VLDTPLFRAYEATKVTKVNPLLKKYLNRLLKKTTITATVFKWVIRAHGDHEE